MQHATEPSPPPPPTPQALAATATQNAATLPAHTVLPTRLPSSSLSDPVVLNWDHKPVEEYTPLKKKQRQPAAPPLNREVRRRRRCRCRCA